MALINPRSRLAKNKPVKKVRKPRSPMNAYGKSAARFGGKNYDLCTCCGYPECDPIYGINPSPSMIKIQNRLRTGKCMGCGKEKSKCTCKSKK